MQTGRPAGENNTKPHHKERELRLVVQKGNCVYCKRGGGVLSGLRGEIPKECLQGEVGNFEKSIETEIHKGLGGGKKVID